MKVIKRDGRIVTYDRAKVREAIENANQDVREADRATNEEIKEIIYYIEDLNKTRMLAEDIQDIVEEKLMELNKFQLAKAYIIYRYQRALAVEQSKNNSPIIELVRDNSDELAGNIANKNMMLA